MKQKNKLQVSALVLIILLSLITGYPDLSAKLYENLEQDFHVPDNKVLTGQIYNEFFTESERPAQETTIESFNRISSAIGRVSETNDLIFYKLQLEELIRRHPELISELRTQILNTANTQRSRLAMIHALQQTGSEESQHLLYEIATNEEFAEAEKMQAIVSIADLENISNEAIESIWKAYKDDKNSENLHNAAVLNLGIAASAAANKNNALSDEIVSILESELASAPEANKDILIEAIGNTESARTIDILKPYLNAAKSEIRASAAYSIRFAKDSRKENLLLELIKNDRSANVRLSAINSLHTGTPSENAISETGNILFNEQDIQVRAAIIRKLGLNKDSKVSSTILNAQLKIESDDNNYNNIIKMLHSS